MEALLRVLEFHLWVISEEAGNASLFKEELIPTSRELYHHLGVCAHLVGFTEGGRCMQCGRFCLYLLRFDDLCSDSKVPKDN